MTTDRVTCPKCNGHGFFIRAENMAQDWRTGRMYVESITTRPPTDKEAESDLSDFELRECNCFFGTVKADQLPMDGAA